MAVPADVAADLSMMVSILGRVTTIGTILAQGLDTHTSPGEAGHVSDARQYLLNGGGVLSHAGERGRFWERHLAGCITK